MIYLKNVTTLKYDAEKCVGCGRCVEVCPHGVFEMKNKRAVLGDRDRCMECGACEKNCGYKAIQVRAGVGCAYGVSRGIGSDTGKDVGQASYACSEQLSEKPLPGNSSSASCCG
jgi:NAD-dependent dihydropyrimidine dehydrogenase PreA subunit